LISPFLQFDFYNVSSIQFKESCIVGGRPRGDTMVK